jgi:transposase
LLNIPEAAAIAESWLVLIKDLFRNSGERFLCEPESPEYAQADARLKATLKTMQDRCASLLQSKGLHPELTRILKGIQSDWEGLSLFASLAQIPPENNKAERALRNPVVGRKNYYGCYSSWSGELAAIMFSLHQTLAIHKINFYDFHHEYLTACARNGGKAPPDAARFLPWHRKGKTPPPAPD